MSALGQDPRNYDLRLAFVVRCDYKNEIASRGNLEMPRSRMRDGRLHHFPDGPAPLAPADLAPKVFRSDRFLQILEGNDC